ncbi:SpaA isopeptide-forming pilin-related protein [uncultured Oscillibacter sp.]|uniref:SpaA isopeptide-forming pilin-related protein n=1 Tax=uncultured Oscillibacter sp. TaxID=876091 RepID=UPI0025EAA917|nr:SpaA isopeptide-forming pilin-related protein [uncultured Oscillibacter sp.]
MRVRNTRARKGKAFSLLMAVLLAMQLLPLNFVQAVQETPAGGPMMMPLAMGGSVKDLTDTKYLVIHGDDYNPSNQKSEIKITDSSGKEILPEKKDSGIYYNAPSGANLMLKLGFHLVEGEENVMTYDYEDGDFFNFRLPEGLTFEPLSGITVKDGSGTTIGTASISGNTLTVEFNANVEGQYGIWGNITINGTFKNIASGAPEETSFSLGSQTVVIERDTDDPPPVPGKVNLDKNGVFLPSGNIRWTVTVTPESDTTSLAGYLLKDTYSANQTYVTGSFTVKSLTDTAPRTIAEADITKSTNSISYTFPDGTEGKQIVTYETTPSFSGTPGSDAFKNTAELYRSSTDTSPLKAEKELTTGAVIQKEGGNVQPDKEGRIDWKITVKVPKAYDADGNERTVYLPNAKIIDEMDPALELIADSMYYNLNSEGPNLVSATTTNEAGKYSFVKADPPTTEKHTLTYLFENGSPQSGDTVVLTYSTKVKDWDSLASSNQKLTFTNNARFEWTWDPDGDGPVSGSTISFGTGEVKKESQQYGYIAKSTPGPNPANFVGEDSRYIKWTTTVNSNHVKLTAPVVKDSIQDGHELVIDPNHNFTVKSQTTGGVVTTIGTYTGFANPVTNAQSDGDTTLTVTDAAKSGFTLVLPVTPNSTDSYIIEYYTYVTDSGLEKLYKGNGHISPNTIVGFANITELWLDNKISDTASAEKNFNLEMMNKRGSAYNVADRFIQWTVVANRNQLPLTGATISDVLPEGLELWIDNDAHKFEIQAMVGSTKSAKTELIYDEDLTAPAPADLIGTKREAYPGVDKSKGFQITLPLSTSAQFTVTFWTRVTDEYLKKIGDGSGFWDTNKQHAFPNKATLNWTNLGGGSESDIFTVTGKNPMISKRGTVGGDETTLWQAVINPSQIKLENGKVTDELSENLQLMDKNSATLTNSSIRLFEIEVNADGTWKTSGFKNPVSVTMGSTADDNHAAYTYNVANRELTVLLPTNTSKAYLLEFDTALIENEKTGPFTNKITLSDGSMSDVGTSQAITVNEASAIGGMYANYITVKKSADAAPSNPGSTASTDLSGAEFALLNSANGNVKKNETEFNEGTGGKTLRDVERKTDTSGEALFNNLPAWVFKVQEVKPPHGYLLSADPAKRIYEVNGGNPISKTNQTLNIVNITNMLAKVNVEIKKIGEANEALSGGLFGLYNKADDSFVQSVPASGAPDMGQVKFTGVEFGDYYIQEITPPDNHEKTFEKIYVKVDYKPGSYTEAQPTYSTDGVTYAAVSTPPTLKNDATPNNDVNPLIAFYKLRTDNNSANPNRGSGPLPAAQFTLKTYPGGAQVDAIQNPDSVSGKVAFSDVPFGKYAIYETVPAGYLNPNANPGANPVFWVDVSYKTTGPITGLRVRLYDNSGFTGAPLFDSQGIDATATLPEVVNLAAVADVSFEKESTASATVKINGGTFQIQGQAAADFPASITGGSIDPVTGVYTATATSVNGVVTFKNVPVNAPGETYTIKEITPPSGYYSTEKQLKAEVRWNADQTALLPLVYWDTNGSVTAAPALQNAPVPSSPSSGRASVMKKDEDGKPLAGAEFTLYDSTGKAIASATSGSNGLVEFTGLAPYSSFTIRETKAPDGYVLSSEELKLSTTSGTSRSFTMVNKKASADASTILVLKTDPDGNPLSGAEFTLYDKDGSAVATGTTGADGKVSFENLPAGQYTVAETRVPNGYVRTAGNQTVTLSKDETRSLTVVNEVKPNVPSSVLGSIRLMKVNSDREPLAGAEFTLYAEDGSVFARGTTGSNGLAVFTDLPIGKYTVRETAAPDGYWLIEDALVVTLPASGAAQSYTLKDAALEEEPEVAGWEEDGIPGKLPQTGGAAPSFFLLLSGIALAVTGFVWSRKEGYLPKHRKK